MASCENTYTVEEAAKLLNMGPQAVRVRMARGLLPIGIVIRNDGDQRKWTYHIYRAWLQRFLEGDPVTVPRNISDYEEVEHGR